MRQHTTMFGDRSTKHEAMASTTQEKVTPLRQAAKLCQLRRESIRELYARRRKEAQAYLEAETKPGTGAPKGSP